MNTAVSQKHLAEATIEKVRRLLQRRAGENGIRGLSRAFNVMDDDGYQKLSKDEFEKGMRNYGILLSKEEMKAVWVYFDRNNDGTITATEFLTALRGGLNPRRLALVHRMYELFNKNSDGSITIEDLRGRFDASRHPAVIKGESTEDEVHRTFLDSFDEQTNPDGNITKQELEQYYSGVSAGIIDDDYFAAMMRAVWNLPGCDANTTLSLASDAEGGDVAKQTTKVIKSTSGGSVGGKTRLFTTMQSINDKEVIVTSMKQKAAFETVMKEHRKIMLAHKMGFRGVGRLLRQKDVNYNHFLAESDFLDCLFQNRLYFKDPSLLNYLDTNRDGTVDYFLYMHYIMPTMPAARQLILERLWRAMPTNSQGCTELSVIHRAYQATNGIALNTFFDAWDARLVPDGKVKFEELLEWMVPISEKTSSDAVFDQIVKEQWKVPK